MRHCKCGREIRPLRNSTIYPKLCANCQLKKAYKTKKEPKKTAKGERAKPIPWRDKPTAAMIQHVQTICNKYIRERDNECFNGKSISDNGRIADAGHFYSRGAKPALRFCVQNIHGQSKSGNMFKSGDLLNYRKGLIDRHGIDYVEQLDYLAANSGGKNALSRYNVRLIGETYLHLLKERIWVFTDKEFQKHKVELATILRIT